jgi:hypothetical protein
MPVRRLLWVPLILLAMLVTSIGSRAQGGAQGSLSQIDPTNFPEISAFLTVYDAEGNFVRDLQPQDVSILENDQEIPVSTLEYLEPGVQFVVALNPGPAFAIRDSQGTSRYDLIANALRNWISSAGGDRGDDLSLLTTIGPRASHLSNPADWQRSFDSYQPDSRNLTPSFDILGEAITLAADATPHPGMARAVLFITPPPDNNAVLALQDVASRAAQLGVRVYVWMIASEGLLDSAGANQLAELAFQSGGSTYRFADTAPFPPVESYLDPLRGIYSLVYPSAARVPGAYTVSAQIEHNTETLVTAPNTIALDVRAPNPVFIQPPAEIERHVPEGAEPDAGLIPTVENLQVLIEFPDNHPRDLVRSTLLVNGEMVAENLQPPFDTFTWDISEYTQNSQQLLQVSVEDTLGLQGQSIETPVEITIEGQATGIASVLVRQAPFLAIIFALAAGAVLLWVLVIGGRLRPADATLPRMGRGRPERSRANSKPRRRDKDPVTQPVPIRDESGRRYSPATRLTSFASRLRLPQRRTPDRPLAYLDLLGPESNGGRGVPQPILETEITLGSSISQSTHLLEDPSVSPYHAKITQRSNGDLWIYDANTTAGTWVNYTPVPNDGLRLRHGDLVHVGRVGFRFRLPDETAARRIVITQEENHQ